MKTAASKLGEFTSVKPNFFWTAVVLCLYFAALIIYSLHLLKWGWDGAYHVSGLAELYEPFSKAQFDNYLSPELAHSSGIPSFIFYSQWLYYPPYLFTKLGFGLMPSFALTFALLIFIAWYGFFKLARFHVSVNFAVLGATLFVTCNSFLGDIYTRFAYGQAFAYALVPISFHALHKAMLSRQRLTLLYPILVLSTIMLTYPVGLMNVGPLLLVYCLIILPSKEKLFEFLAKGFVICLATLCLTAFFWLPGLIEQKFIRGGTAIGKFYTDYSWTLEIALNFTNHVNLGILLNLALIIALCLNVILFRHLHKATFLFVSVALYCFLLTSYSFFILDLIPILEINDSVNRMLIPLSFVTCLYVVVIFDAWRKSVLASSLTLLFCVLMLLQASEFIYRNSARYLSTEAFLQTFPDNINIQLQSHIDFARALRDGVGVGEFKPNISAPLPAPIVPEDACQEIVWLPSYVKDIQRQSIVFEYEVDHVGCYIRMSPYWNVRYTAIDHTGEDLTIGIHQEYLTLMIQPIRKKGTIGIKFSEPKYLKRAKQLSGLTLLLLMLFTMQQTAKCQRRNSN